MYRIARLLGLLALLAALGVTATAAQESCIATGQSTEEVLPGITITWDSAFHCEDAPDEGEYEFTVVVSNDANSSEAVIIDTLALTHTTPRPRGQAPEATTEAPSLPTIIDPGESQSFTVSGSYTLVSVGAEKQANLHFRASGYGPTIEPFYLGLNAMLRGEGVDEPGNGTEPGGPPSWVPGPPPWAGDDDDDDGDGEGPPAWVPGPPPGVGRPGRGGG
ncbi:MAG: hypothetical protein IPM39_19995 [Chloroflexi bacterium]|nr:hypothetical protein [Chloroflexota bacterium]